MLPILFVLFFKFHQNNPDCICWDKSIRNKQKQIIFAHKTPNLYLQTYFPLLILGVRSLKEVNLFLKLNHILPTLWRLASSPWRALTPHHSVQRTTRVPTVHRRFYTNRLMENVVSLWLYAPSSAALTPPRRPPPPVKRALSSESSVRHSRNERPATSKHTGVWPQPTMTSVPRLTAVSVLTQR